MSQKQRSRPTRKKPVNTEVEKNLRKHLVSSLNHHFKFTGGRCNPIKLWDMESEDDNENKIVTSRYRVNWLSWDSNTIIKSAFCHIRDANPDRPANPDKDYEPQYEIKDMT